MSESQKMFASLSGAFIAHLLLLVLVVVIPRTDSVGSSLGGSPPSKPKPREITVLMGDLMMRLERERLEKAAKPEPEMVPEPLPPIPASRPFVATDLNLPEDAAPVNARFESDRNTSAAARLRPDTSLPTEKVPTLDGDNPLPNLTLANRDYVEGPLGELPASPDPVMKRSESPATATGASDSMPSRPAEIGAPPSANSTAPSPIAAILPVPAASRRGGGVQNEGNFSVAPGRGGNDVDGATRRKSFLDPKSGIVTYPDLSEGEDKLAAGTGSGKGGEGEPDPLAPATGEGLKTATESLGEANDTTLPETSPDQILKTSEPAPKSADAPPGQVASPVDSAPATRTADTGLFAKGFSPEERENVINGSLAKEGGNAVDAEGTPMGRYKKAVRDAISAKWHRYKQDNADFVTWGILKLEFSVDPSGQVHNLQITKNEANAMLAEFSLRAIRDADLPPMPADVAKSVGAKGLVIQYDIIIY